MVKKSDHSPVIDEPGLGGEHALAQERDRAFVEEHGLARDDSDLEVRGRRYRIGVEDGFVGIWELRSGEQVGTFMEDAFSAAWARYLELEQFRSLSGFMLRTREFLAHRWYAIVVVVLGALTVVYLKTEDPALAPTGARVRVGGDAPRAVEPIADLGSALAGTLDPSLAAPPPSARSAEEGDERERRKKDRGAANERPAGGGEAGTPPSTSGDASGASASGGTSGGSSTGTAGGSTGGGGEVEPEEPPQEPPQPPPDPPEEPVPPPEP